MKFLKPLVEEMTRKEPSKRPTARDAVKMFNEIIARARVKNLLDNTL